MCLKGWFSMTKDFVQKDLSMNKKSGGLRSTDILLRHPAFFITVISIGCLIFGFLAFLIQMQGALVQWDIAIVNSMHIKALSSPAWVKGIMISGDYLGKQGFIAISILLALYFLIKRFWKEFFMVLIASAAHGLLFLGLTYLFARPRPVFSENIEAVIKFYGFPSGHMISSVICFGFLVYFFVPTISSRFWKAVAILTAMLLVIFVGFSRFFMGAHYMTDIVAGTTVGIVWFCIVVLSIERISRKGEEKNVKQI